MVICSCYNVDGSETTIDPPDKTSDYKPPKDVSSPPAGILKCAWYICSKGLIRLVLFLSSSDRLALTLSLLCVCIALPHIYVYSQCVLSFALH